MAHFAEIDQNNRVLRVLVVANRDTADENGNEVEQIGQDFCNRLLGGSWMQTSYNSNFRKHYAGIGYQYDQARDAFIPPKPYPSWMPPRALTDNPTVIAFLILRFRRKNPNANLRAM